MLTRAANSGIQLISLYKMQQRLQGGIIKHWALELKERGALCLSARASCSGARSSEQGRRRASRCRRRRCGMGPRGPSSAGQSSAGCVPRAPHLQPPSAPRSSASINPAHGGGSADDIKASSSDGFPQLRLCGCSPTRFQCRKCSIKSPWGDRSWLRNSCPMEQPWCHEGLRLAFLLEMVADAGADQLCHFDSAVFRDGILMDLGFRMTN